MIYVTFIIIFLSGLATMVYCVDRGHYWTAFAVFILISSVNLKHGDKKSSSKPKDGDS